MHMSYVRTQIYLDSAIFTRQILKDNQSMCSWHIHWTIVRSYLTWREPPLPSYGHFVHMAANREVTSKVVRNWILVLLWLPEVTHLSDLQCFLQVLGITYQISHCISNTEITRICAQNIHANHLLMPNNVSNTSSYLTPLLTYFAPLNFIGTFALWCTSCKCYSLFAIH